MIWGRKDSALSNQRIILIALALVVCLLYFLTVRNSSAPTIDLQFGDTSIFIAADRDWTLLPGDCVNLRWRLEGIESLYVDGGGKIGADDMRFCPDINATSPLFEIRAQNGIYRSFRLNINHLPDLLFYLFGFVLLVASPLFAVYYLLLKRIERPLPIFWLLLGAMVLIVLGAWLRLRPYEPPLIDEANEDFAIRIWADHDRSLFPHECVRVWWSVTGAQSVHFNGRETATESNPAFADHCAEDGDFAKIEVLDVDGESADYSLPISSRFPHSAVPPPFFYVSLLGIVLGALIYLPLLARRLQECRIPELRAEVISILGCFFVVLVLYLPFGFDSSAHWEAWIVHGYAEGGTLSFYATEAVSRPWVNVPRTLAYLFSSETFIGYHIVNFLLYAGEMTFLYIILRQLGVSPLYAFLTTVLFIVYPVNDDLMTLRRLPNNFSVMSLLLATVLFLDYCKRPKRLTLLGMWLALLYCVNSNETGYVIILVVPCMLWLRDRRLTWRNVNLSALWYLAPFLKLGSVILLLATGRDFYQSGLLRNGAETEGAASSVIETFFEVLSLVYRQTFISGWGDALNTLNMNQWWLPTLVIVAGVGLIAWYHISQTPAEPARPRRQILGALIAGLALIIAAIGLLMWVPFYREDSWRMYMFVPIGAAVAVFSLILLAVSPIQDNRRRSAAVAVVCLLLGVPTVSRLFAQHNGFVESAYRKARILYQVMEIAPALSPGAQLAMVTKPDHIELGERGMREFIATDMLNSAMHVLYQDDAPEYAYFCHTMKYCGDFSGDETIFSSAAPGDLLGRTLVFILHDDDRVELVEDPAALLGLDMEAPYDAGALYNADAPLPPRATSMLAAAVRG